MRKTFRAWRKHSILILHEPRLTFVVPLRAGLTLAEDLDGDGKLDLSVMSYETQNAIILFRNLSAPGKLDTNSFARFDLIENGQFVEIGAHEELLAKGGRYAELFALQAAGYR